MTDKQVLAEQRPLYSTALAAVLAAMDISPTVALSVLNLSSGPDHAHRPKPSSQHAKTTRNLDMAISLGIGVRAIESAMDESGTGRGGGTDPNVPTRPRGRLAAVLGRFRVPLDPVHPNAAPLWIDTARGRSRPRRRPHRGHSGTSGRLESPMSGDRFGGGSGDAGDCLPTSGELIAGLNRLRDAMAQVQHDIENVIVHGHSRGNMVTATMRGDGQLVDITIDPDRSRRRTTDDLGRVVAEAVNDALLKLGDTTRARITFLLTSPDAA